MILFPAIDLKGGRVVRLMQGDFDTETEYSIDPVEIARQWEAKGARWLHVVDLDGAQFGAVKNHDLIVRIAQAVKIPVQMGGGVRTQNEVSLLLENGVARVVFGTRVVEDRDFVRYMLKIWGERIAVSLDCRDGMVTTRGWTQVTDIQAVDLAGSLAGDGLRYLIYTDVKRDGMLSGPNFQALDDLLAAVRIPVIASGGIATLADVKRLLTLVPKGLVGAITGKAIYEGTLDFGEAARLCSQNA